MTLEAGKRFVGKGWHQLLDELWAVKPAGVDVTTVKEKFGQLRIYFHCADGEEFRDFEAEVGRLEQQSSLVCEQCGAPGELRKSSEKRWWVKTLCTRHHEENAVGLLI